MNDFNILLTSVGRRSYLVEYFRQALHGRGKVICTNMYAHAAGMYAADKAVVTPPSCDKSYVPQVIDMCRQYNIKLIFSFHDLDVYILSQHINQLRETGAVPVLPDPNWGRITLDKYECTCVLKDNGFDVPWTSINLDEAVNAIADSELLFPVIVKSRMGFGSQGLWTCKSLDELKWAYDSAMQKIQDFGTSNYLPIPEKQGVLIQQGIVGREYCLDVVNNLSGNYVCSFMADIHAMRAGESDMATTVDPAIAGDLASRFSKLTNHIGIWGVDCMDDHGILRVIDVNPRFTGDYPFHQIAGANIPAAIVAWAKGGEPDPAWLRSEIGIRGYKDLVPNKSTILMNNF